MIIGWNFPSCGGGNQSGLNHPGVETFSGQPFENLAREIIQNSLDARAYDDKPVIVKFVVGDIDSEQFPDRDSFVNTLNKCLKESRGDKNAEKFFQNAISILGKNEKVKCLYISDHNTTGLRDDKSGRQIDQWKRLVKKDGQTGQDSQAGGSYGIGKNAPFAVSNLRTVFYYTLYKENGNVMRKAQGKSILISHDLGNGDYSQATGFYGIKEQCEKMTGKSIPDLFRSQRQDDDEGTTLLIPGLINSKNWMEQFTFMVIANFFQAIHKGDLNVVVGDIQINANTLPLLFSDKNIIRQETEEGKAAYAYYQATVDDQSAIIKEKTLPILKHCVLRFIIKEGYPQQVAFLRRGMKITDTQKSLKRWPGCADFVAICYCRDSNGNALLREMENPAHNAFEPARLMEKKEDGEKALKEISEWVRKTIKDQTAQVSNKPTDLSKMIEFFSSEDDNLPGENNEEQDFDGESKVLRKPTRIRPSIPDPIEDQNRGGDGDEEGNGENRNDGDGGDSENKTGTNGDKTVTEAPIVIYATRVIAKQNEHEKLIMFTPAEEGLAVLSIKIAGDSFYEPVEASEVSGGNACIVDGNILLNVKKDRRVKLTVSILNGGDSALSLSLAKAKKEE